MWAIPLTAIIVCLTLIYLQKMNVKIDQANAKGLSYLKLEQRLIGIENKTEEASKEFLEYKKRIDVLTLKAGFKL